MKGIDVLDVPFSFSIIAIIHFQTCTMHLWVVLMFGFVFNIQTPESINLLTERKSLCCLDNSVSTEKVRFLLKRHETRIVCESACIIKHCVT